MIKEIMITSKSRLRPNLTKTLVNFAAVRGSTFGHFSNSPIYSIKFDLIGFNSLHLQVPDVKFLPKPRGLHIHNEWCSQDTLSDFNCSRKVQVRIF